MAQPVAMPGAQVTSTTDQVTTWSTARTSCSPETVNHVSTFAKVLGGGTYSELIWALAIVVVLQIVLTFTRWGLYTVAVGSNKLGRRRGGVRVRLVMIRNFILCAPPAASSGSSRPCGPRRCSRTSPGRTKSCSTAISAAVIGGTLLAGGSGTVVGALIGALFLGILNDGLILQGVERRLPALLPGPGDHPGDDHQRVRAARAQGCPKWLIDRRTGGDDRRGRSRPRTTCCASSTSPSASGR